MLLISSRQRPGLPANVLRCTERPTINQYLAQNVSTAEAEIFCSRGNKTTKKGEVPQRLRSSKRSDGNITTLVARSVINAFNIT